MILLLELNKRVWVEHTIRDSQPNSRNKDRCIHMISKAHEEDRNWNGTLQLCERKAREISIKSCLAHHMKNNGITEIWVDRSFLQIWVQMNPFNLENQMTYIKSILTGSNSPNVL
jgi:hypothetical protein